MSSLELTRSDPAPGRVRDASPVIAVILPCYNEGKSIARCVRDFAVALPSAHIYVFDNNSRDDTVAEAERAGAIVHKVVAQGKGNVLRQAFAKLDADCYLIADGDGTYDARRAPELVAKVVDEGFDMVVGVRKSDEEAAYRGGHVLGNRIFNSIVSSMFAGAFTDIFSGYRAFSRSFVKSFPALASGFETETEMTLHAIQLGLPCAEIATSYRARVSGSASKLRTYHDGARILWFIARLVKHLRPLFLFAAFAGLMALLSVLIGGPVVTEFWHTGLVPRLPTALAAASLMIIAAISLVTGVILDSVAYAQCELKRLAYLAVAPRSSQLPRGADSAPARGQGSGGTPTVLGKTTG